MQEVCLLSCHLVRMFVGRSKLADGWGWVTILATASPAPSIPCPFPFGKGTGASGEALAELGDRLDSFRKERLKEHEFLTMTSLYNVLERVRELDNGCDVPLLTTKEKEIHKAGLVSVLKDIHDEIDRAVFRSLWLG